MGSDSLARNHFQAVVRDSRGLLFLKVSKKCNDADWGYRASNMITIPYMMLVGAHFKSVVGGIRDSIP